MYLQRIKRIRKRRNLVIKFIKNLFSKKEIVSEKTRMVQSENGFSVELPEDMPDSYADVISECFKTGKMLSGRIDEKGKITLDKNFGGKNETLG
jgi:hypothetical protein